METSNKVNTNTLSVNTLFMKEPYVGTFDICGGLSVSITSTLNDLNVTGVSIFSGPSTFTESFTTLGNIDSSDSANIKNNVVLGNTIYFDSGKNQFIYGNVNGLGVNINSPQAAIDVSTNLIKGFNIISSQNQNISTLAQNNSGKGVQVGVDSNTSYVNFFNDHSVSSGIVDGNITYSNGGFLTVDVQKNINLLAPISITNRVNVAHVNDETVVIYDTSKNVFFGNVYNNKSAVTGAALSLISNDLSSNTFMYFTTPDKKGSGIGGGAYPDDVKRSMGVIVLTDSSGESTPSQVIVTGNDSIKYKTTTGINTFKPRVDNYVLDINGPVHIDNGDITNTSNQNFEIYSMSMAKNYKNNILAIGSSYDVTTVSYDIGEGENQIYREKLLKSTDFGKTWSTNEIPITTQGMNKVTSVHMYDQSSCFLTGEINFLRYSPDGGYNWNALINTLPPDTYNNFFVNPKQKTNGNVVCFFSLDASFSLFSFEMPVISNLEGYLDFSNNKNFNINDTLKMNYPPNTKQYIDRINDIYVNDNSLYLAGNAILKYNITNESWPTFNTPSVHTYSTYSYNGINAFDNSFVIAVGKNIISSTTDGGITWRDTTFDTLNNNEGIDLNSVYIYDLSNAVAAGSQGNIWVTNDRGLTWNYMPFNLLNSSGKKYVISSSKNNYKNIVMPDINTIVLSNNTQSYIQVPYGQPATLGQQGISNMYNIFVPNFLNRSNNIVFDISGTMNISGDLKMSDNGEMVSNNSTMNIFRKNVNTLNIGAGTETINIGNTLVGNTIIKNNLINNGVARFINTVITTGNAIFSNVQVNNTTILNGNIGVNTIPKYTLDISGNIFTRSGLYVFNKLGVNTTNPQYDVDISGIVNIQKNLFLLSDVSMSANVYIQGNVVYDSMSKFNQGILVNNSNISVTGNIYGNIYPLVNTIEIGGANNDIYIGSKTNTTREQSIYIGQGGLSTSQEKVSKIYIGGQNDYVYLRGNTTILQQVQQNVTSQTILLNNTGTGANATSGGAGIDIYDNSYSTIVFKNVYGYMRVGTDLQSFIFKAPSYGAYNGTTPAPNTKNSLSLISPENRVRLGVNELKLAKNEYVPVYGNVRTGLLVLQTNSDFINYQYGLNHNYSSSTDADYAINISNAFDISNIMLKQFDTVSGSQSIGSAVVIGNSKVPYDLSVYGNVMLYRNTSINGNTILYGNLEIVGNTVMPNITITNTLVSSGNTLLSGKIGIGTNTPQILLDVYGNVRVIGQMVNTNYDSIQFPSNFNNNWIDNSIQSLSDSYYQDITASHDSQYQYAFLYNKASTSSIIKSSNFGESWSQIQLTDQTSLTIIDQSVPTMNANTVTFSRTTLVENLLPGNIYLNTQIGTYVASGSSVSPPSSYYFLFDNNDNTLWTNETAKYSKNNTKNALSNYIWNSGDVYSTQIINSNNNPGVWTGNPCIFYGEYIQISLPYSFTLTKLIVSNDNTISSKAAKRIIVVGSSNGNDWYVISTCANAIDLISQNSNTTYNTSNFFNVPDSLNAYSYFRFIVVATYNQGTANANDNVSIKNLKLSGMVQNSTGTYAATISASGNGKFVTIANQGYNNNTGNIYVSNDYGATYTNTNAQPLQIDGSGIWQSVTISQSGKYQYATISSIVGKGNIWKSTDFGNSWMDSQFGVYNGFQSISVSSTGQYVTAIQSGNASVPRGNIWVSNNYGTTWSSVQQIYSYMPFNNGFLNQGSIDFNKIVSVSINGKFQTALGIAPTDNKIGGNANIWYNNNYGQGEWSDSGYSAPNINGTVSILSCVSMTGTGQYQTVSFIGGNSNVSSQVYGNILRSTDYGVTWTDTNFKIPSVNKNSNTVYGYLPKIVTSMNGKIITGISKYQSLRDVSYNNNNSTQTAVGNIFTSVIPTTSQMNTTQYFGSPHTGNVFQVHGYQLNVPINNNSSLMMGCDTAWDSVYINAADQNGYNAICLNTTGGPVGVSKINPDHRFVLDISGIVNIDNDNGVILLQGNSLNNMGIGKSVLNNITTGSNNTGVGYDTLSSITTGSKNTALGYQAFTSTNYSQSTAIGFNSQPTANNQIVLGTITEKVYIPGNTQSVNSSTGSLQVVGGAGIGGNVNIDGNVNIGGNTTMNRNINIGGNINLSGNINIDVNMNVTGNTLLNGNLKVGTNSLDSRQIIISGGSSFGYVYGANNKYSNSINIGYNFYNNNVTNVINNTGIATSRIYTGAGIIAMYTGVVNTEPSTLGYYQNSSGNVGIKNDNPTVPLDINGTTRIFQNSQNTSALLITSTSYLVNSINIYTNISTTGFNGISTLNDCGIIWGTGPSGGTQSGDFVICPWNSNTYGIKITRGGFVGINKATPTVALDVTGDITSSAGVTCTTVTASGAITCTTVTASGAITTSTTITATGRITAGSFNTNSDYRIKQNVQVLSKTVDQLNPVEYDLSGGKHDMGFIAHEVQEIFPFLVNGQKDGDQLQSINYTGFISLLVKEVQDLKKENKRLHEINDQFEKRLKVIESMMYI